MKLDAAAPESAAIQRNERGHFIKGISPNPGGKPARMAELQAMAQQTFPSAIKRLTELIESRDDEMAFKAVSLCLLYLLGKPPENRELLLAEQMRARLTELVVVPTLTQAPVTSSPPSTPEQASQPVEPSLPPEPQAVATPPEALDAVTPVQVPSGLRCLYRNHEGQCEANAEGGGNWCKPHRDRLFSMVNA